MPWLDEGEAVFFELDMRFSKSMPYTFTLPDTLIAKMVAGKVVNLLQGSNFAAPKMVAAGTDTKGQPNQVNVGSAAANTRANLINFLTNQTHPEGVTNKHGYRVQYDVDDPENWKNLQRANMYIHLVSRRNGLSCCHGTQPYGLWRNDASEVSR